MHNGLFFVFQFYLVMKGHGKQDETSMTSKSGPGKFVTSKVRVAHNSLSQVQSSFSPLSFNSLPSSNVINVIHSCCVHLEVNDQTMDGLKKALTSETKDGH